MKKYILLFLLLPLLLFGQSPLSETVFTASDTLSVITGQDTVSWAIAAANSPAIASLVYTDITNYLSQAEKQAETEQIYDVTGESGYVYAPTVYLRIVGTGGTLYSKSINMSGRSSLTFFLRPDTVLAGYTSFVNSRIEAK